VTEDVDPSSISLNTRLALVRTELAFERTLMAWVRTSVSLITFGFTLYKAFEYLGQHEAPAAREHAAAEARHFGVAMIATGVIGLILALYEHLKRVRRTRALDSELPVVTVASVVAVLFAAIGSWLLIQALVREHRIPVP
jgi:putative membrane protein